MNVKLIGYWTVTIILAFFIGTGGIAYLLQADFTVEGFVVLGLPAYVMVLIGFWKVAGSIVLLVPGIPRIKEWAYFGIFIDVTGAIVAHAAVSDYGAYGFHIVVNVIFAILVMASWALRPDNRILGRVEQF